MVIIDFDNLLIRGSAMGDVMTAGHTDGLTELQAATVDKWTAKRKMEALSITQEKEYARLIDKRDNPQLSKTCINRLIKIVAKESGREEVVSSKYMEKGTLVEEDTITLDCRVNKHVRYKNERELSNRFVKGTPDAGDNEEILKSEEITDYKSSWSYETFLAAKFDKVNKDYQWQGDTYLALVPGAKRFRLAYGLVNCPAELILKEKSKIKWDLGVLDESAALLHPDYIDACKQIERNHIFDMATFQKSYPWFEFHSDLSEWTYDLPMKDRLFQVVIERSPERIDEMYKKVVRCRKWLKEQFA